MASYTENPPETARLLDDVVEGKVNYNGRLCRRSDSGKWKSAGFIICVEIAERFAFYGITSNLINYLTGALGQSTVVAAENVNAWSGTAALLPLLGAFLADSFLGRYRTIIFSSLLYILALGFLTILAILPSDCENLPGNFECSPPKLHVVFFFFSLYLVAAAQGGHKPCVQAFGADQFDTNNIEECKAKSSFFNWWYFGMCGGNVVTISMLNYIQDNLGWGLGFGIPCIALCLALVVFLLGTKTYRFSNNVDERNPFMSIGLVVIRAIRNWRSTPHSSVEDAATETFQYQKDSHQFEFLDKALLAPPGANKEQDVCSLSDVEDAKAIFRLFPIWATCLVYAIVFAQPFTFFTKQGVTMDRWITQSFEVPSAALQSFMSLAVLIFIPVYDKILVPIARGITGKPSGITLLQRIGTGIMLSIVCLIVSALVERRRLEVALEHGLIDLPNATIPMSVCWLIPQFLIFGIVESFTMVGLQEFFYDQVPSKLKSLGLALYLSISGVGGLLSSLLISVIQKATSGGESEAGWFSDNLNRAHLDYFYLLLAGLSIVSLMAYIYFARSYTRT